MKVDMNHLEALCVGGQNVKVDFARLGFPEYENPAWGANYKWALPAIAGAATGMCMFYAASAGTAGADMTEAVLQRGISRMAQTAEHTGVTESAPVITPSSATEEEIMEVPKPIEEITAENPTKSTKEETARTITEEVMAIEDVTAETPAAEETVTEEITTETPVAEESATEEITAEMPAAEESVAEELNAVTADDTVAEFEENAVKEVTITHHMATEEESVLNEPAAGTYIASLAEEIPALAIADVDTTLNVRMEPSADSKKVGVLENGCGGEILEQADGWTKIESGEMVGWVRDTYMLFGEEAKAAGCFTATPTTLLNVREASNADSTILGTVDGSDTLTVTGDGDEGWIEVEFNGQSGYVSTKYTDVKFTVDSGEPVKETQKQAAVEASAEIAEEKAAAPVAASGGDVQQLAAIIFCEAGGEPYEGKVAVGAVVLNRVNSGSFPNSISEVIRAPRQFSPVASGKFDRVLAGNVPADCVQAANEALAGVSPVGGCLYFKNPHIAGAHAGITIGNHVFW